MCATDKISFWADFELSSVWLRQVYPDLSVLNLKPNNEHYYPYIPDDGSKEKVTAHKNATYGHIIQTIM